MKFSAGSVNIEFVRRAGLISIFNKAWKPGSKWSAIHFGVYPHLDVYYKSKGDREVKVEAYWVWGRATELYDHSIEYFGLGPLLLVCW